MKSEEKQCVWCCGSVDATDVSHVLPECFGNRDQQVLPRGIVCRACNNYFGTKIEPAFDEDPVVRARAVASRIVDPGDLNVFRDRLFDPPHVPIAPLVRTMALDSSIVGGQVMEVAVRYEVKGTIRKKYDQKSLARFSRAVHKVAFESFVWLTLNNEAWKAVDVLDKRFDPVRRWAKGGQPQHRVRAVARNPGSRGVEPDWKSHVFAFDNDLALGLCLFGDQFAVSLTSSAKDAEPHLREWFRKDKNALLMAESVTPLSQD